MPAAINLPSDGCFELVNPVDKQAEFTSFEPPNPDTVIKILNTGCQNDLVEMRPSYPHFFCFYYDPKPPLFSYHIVLPRLKPASEKIPFRRIKYLEEDWVESDGESLDIEDGIM